MYTVAEKNNAVLTLIIHGLIAVSTAVTAYIGIRYGAGDGQLGGNMIGAGYFKAFTLYINLLAGISSLIIIWLTVRNLRKKENRMPKWAVIFQFMTTTGLFATFVMVALILAPMDVLDGHSYFGMFTNDMFVFHLVNPLLAVFAFIRLQKNCSLCGKECLWGIVPMTIYVLVYCLMVLVFQRWEDFYGFSLGGHYELTPLVLVVVFSVALLAAWLLLRWNRKSSAADFSIREK